MVFPVITTQRIESFRINNGFTKGRDNDVCNLSLDTEDALLNNPFFPSLPVSLADLVTYRVAFSAAMVEARKGGTDRTRLKKTAKLVLVDALMKIAFYCQGVARHELMRGRVRALQNRPLPPGWTHSAAGRPGARLSQPQQREWHGGQS
jgi:hypothetical protein